MRLIALLALTACKDVTNPDSEAPDTSIPAATSTFDPAWFTDGATFRSADEVDCTLSDGSQTTCVALVFGSNPVPEGPYCPANADDIAGLGAYDGPTHPGLQALNRTLFEAMEADGYDIIDPDGAVHITDPAERPEDPQASYCLEATRDDGLTVTVFIPLEPSLLSTPRQLGEVDPLGLALDGYPLAGDPPSVVARGHIPAIDPCGGHQDPAGYYHGHLASSAINALLVHLGIEDVQCTNATQDTDALVGVALDGFAIYGSTENGVVPGDLDDCGGHSSATAELPDGAYHYHTLSDEGPDLPGCLVGASVERAVEIQ